jgi:hypothetical protein
MYAPTLTEIDRFDLANAKEFVEFWGRFYSDNVTVFRTEQQIDYLSELNIGGDLTEENVRRLLRWKDKRMLTELILSGPNEGKPNKRVAKVLDNLSTLNRFRNDELNEETMRHATEEIFESGIVWRSFLLHIAKPHSHPIGDVNVFRACELHTGVRDEQTWETYEAYRAYFGKIAGVLGTAQTPENIGPLKFIDDALWTFGEFLGAYHPSFAGKPAAKKVSASSA